MIFRILKNVFFLGRFLYRASSTIHKDYRLGWNQSGFTLIEMLVTTMILSVMVGLAFFAMGLYLKGWESNRFGDTSTIMDYRTQTLVRNSMESVWEYFVTDPANERIDVFYPFFKGKKTEVVGVTTSSVFHKGVPALFRFRLDAEDKAEKSLIYEETPLDDGFIRYENDLPAFSYSMVFMRRIKKLHFRYYGLWEILPPQGDGEDVIMVYRWLDVFDGRDRNAIPKIIEINLEMPETERQLIFYVMSDNMSKAAMYATF